MKAKPWLADLYIDEFNKTQSFEFAAANLKVCPNAIKMYFRRNGIRIIKKAVKVKP